MSRRNTREGKARRRAERERQRRSIGQGPRAVEVQAVQVARWPYGAGPRNDGADPRNSGEHGSGVRSDADGGLIAVEHAEADLDTDADLGNADPGDFGGLDPGDADLQAALAHASEASGYVVAAFASVAAYRGNVALAPGKPVTVISFEGTIADGAAGNRGPTPSLSAAIRSTLCPAI